MKLFGTDGIRANSNSELLSEENVYMIGYSLGLWAKDEGYKSVIIGKDTRESSNNIEKWLIYAFQKTGLEAMLVGVVPTPAISYICKELGSLGVMITASHNPFYDNGIKLFCKSGRKTNSKEEEAIEKLYYDFSKGTQKFARYSSEGLVKDSSEFKGIIQSKLRGLYLSGFEKISDFKIKKKIVLDCANGVNSFIAKGIIEKVASSLKIINAMPNGQNINYNCGAMHPDIISKNVLLEKADIGIAFDGDADRVVFCDEKGEIIDGDHYIGFLAQNIIPKEVVYTDYSNLALDYFLRRNGIEGIRVQNGDKAVSDELSKRNLPFGGEKSGHYIFKDFGDSGDGLLSAIRLLSFLSKLNVPISKMKQFELYPQAIVSSEVKRKRDFSEIDGLDEMLKTTKSILGEDSRINIRYSGTEMKIRVLAEGNNQEKCNNSAIKIAEFIKEANK